MKDVWKGFYSLVAATFLYSFFGVLAKIIGFNLGLFYGAWTRSVLSAAVLLIILLIQGTWISVHKKDWPWIVARGVAGSLFAFLMNYYAFYYLPIATALFIFYAGSTIGGYFLGRLLFHEHLNRIKIISLLLALIGLGTIYLVNFKISNPFHMALALGGGTATAVWNTFSKKISGNYSALQLNLLDMVISTGVYFIGFIVMQESWVPVAVNKIWIASMLFGLMFILTGQLVVWGFKYLDAQIGSIVMLSEIIFGTILGWILFQEVLTLYTCIGGAIIIIAILYPELSLLYQKRQKYSQ